ncbi:MAG: DUF2141 domain-containing protein [Proteobacteria bacterium]|nr:MAG: DUF2141 domain-containing protein [Pseudomonadota bacterium]
MNRIFQAGALVLAMGLGQFAMAAPKADLTISISGMRNAKGSVLVAVFKDGVGFPSDNDKAHDNLKLTPGQAQKFVLEDLPPGDYAIALLHDENNNGRMDKKAVFLPKEGFGFSNDAMGTMGPPSYKKAKFTVTAPKTSIRLKMKYM